MPGTRAACREFWQRERPPVRKKGNPRTFSGGLFAQEKGSLLWQASPCNGPQCRFLPVCFAANAGKGKPLAALGMPYNKHSVNNNAYYMAKRKGLSRVDAGKIHKFRCLNLEETPIDKREMVFPGQKSRLGKTVFPVKKRPVASWLVAQPVVIRYTGEKRRNLV